MATAAAIARPKMGDGLGVFAQSFGEEAFVFFVFPLDGQHPFQRGMGQEVVYVPLFASASPCVSEETSPQPRHGGAYVGIETPSEGQGAHSPYSNGLFLWQVDKEHVKAFLFHGSATFWGSVEF